ncbi:neprilysin-1-like [Haemaphysalis longicornis]
MRDDQTFASAALRIAGMALAVALCVVMLRAFLKTTEGHLASVNHTAICNSSSCDRLAAALLYSMMPAGEADPCDDFYHFVCGRYDRLEVPGTPFDWVLAEANRHVRNQASAVADKIVPPASSNRSSPEYTLMQKVQSLYDACMRPTQERGSFPPLRAFVHKQGLGFSQADATATDAVETMLRLSYVYDVQSVLEARLLSSSHQPDRPLLLR